MYVFSIHVISISGDAPFPRSHAVGRSGWPVMGAFAQTAARPMILSLNLLFEGLFEPGPPLGGFFFGLEELWLSETCGGPLDDDERDRSRHAAAAPGMIRLRPTVGQALQLIQAVDAALAFPAEPVRDLGQVRGPEEIEEAHAALDLGPLAVRELDSLAPAADRNEFVAAGDMRVDQEGAVTVLALEEHGVDRQIATRQRLDGEDHAADPRGRIAAEGDTCPVTTVPTPVEDHAVEMLGFRAGDEVPQGSAHDGVTGEVRRVVDRGELEPGGVDGHDQVVRVDPVVCGGEFGGQGSARLRALGERARETIGLLCRRELR